MENVGQSKLRNEEFKSKFSRDKLLQHVVSVERPVVFDIGAHRGESVAYLKRIFPKATVYSFEPDPDSFAALSATSIDGVSYFNLALSNADGTAIFNRNRISHTNSLLKVNLKSKDSIGITKATAEKNTKFFDDFNEEIRVTTVTLDSFSRQHSINIIDLLKIDVQGAECNVLAGGHATLAHTKVVIIEISFYDYYEKSSTFLDVEQILSPLGFRLFSISEVSNNPMNGRTDWAEVVYINHSMLNPP